MQKLEHWDILISNKVNKKTFIEIVLSEEATEKLSSFKNLHGILFSDLAISEFIEKESQYDISQSGTESKRKLNTFSSGERKKEFLKYCINQKPDYLIVDNPMDHLDQDSRKSLKIILEKLSESIPIIQLVNRSADLFPFIKNKAQITDNSFILNTINSAKTAHIDLQNTAIPSAIKTSLNPNIELIKLEDVSVSYEGRKIINQIHWTIKKGKFWQLIGPNGSGKSTLLSMITGDNPKGYGQNLFLFGRKKGSGETIWEIKKRIGIYSTSMTDLFQKKDTVENIILSGFFDSIGLYGSYFFTETYCPEMA